MKQFRIEKRITMRDGTIEKYFSDIQKYLPLPAKEELEIVKLAKAGCKKSEEKIIKHNLRFVVSVAKKYESSLRGSALNLSDLIQYGSEGIIEAIERFDYTRGFKFISYAVWWIRQRIIFGIQNESHFVTINSNMSNKINTINTVNSKYECDLSIDDIVEITGISYKSAKEAQQAYQSFNKIRSIEEPVVNGDSDSISLIETIESSENFHERYEADNVKRAVQSALGALKKEERYIISKLYGIGYEREHTINEIAKELGCTKQRVYQKKLLALEILSRQKKQIASIAFV